MSGSVCFSTCSYPLVSPSVLFSMARFLHFLPMEHPWKEQPSPVRTPLLLPWTRLLNMRISPWCHQADPCSRPHGQSGSGRLQWRDAISGTTSNEKSELFRPWHTCRLLVSFLLLPPCSTSDGVLFFLCYGFLPRLLVGTG